jgi:hypothetical protein
MSKLLKLSDTPYIVVNDSEIKKGDWCVYKTGEIIQYLVKLNTDNLRKITHSTEPIERYDHPAGGYEGIFDKIKQLPLSEVEEVINGYSVEKMAEKFVIEKLKISSQAPGVMIGYIEGFKAHQELVKDKLFSLATVEGCMMSIANWIVKNNITSGTEILTKMVEISESLLLPKTEWEVEFDEQGKLKLI